MTTPARGERVEGLTRSQLEALRGPLANGNGAGDLVGLHDSQTAVSNGAKCSECDRPARQRQHTCSPEHAKVRKLRLDRERRGSGADKPRRWPGRQRKPAVEHVPPTPALGLFDLLASLAAALPDGVRLSVEVAGTIITAARVSRTGG
jgi:hypothetical protein